MTNDQILAYATLILVGFTAASLVLGVVLYLRQCNSQIYLEYTKRYSVIMDKFPPEGLKARLDLFAKPPEGSDELRSPHCATSTCAQRSSISTRRSTSPATSGEYGKLS